VVVVLSFGPGTRALAGKTVGIVLKISYGGPKSAKMNEEGFLDELSVMANE
jgi:hypothetical protein